MEGMELSFHGFSIREYTSEMRSKDVSKCWLFSSTETDHLSQDVLRNYLPEITVRKFRWWAHELQALGSNSNYASSSTQLLVNQQTSLGLLVDGNSQLEGEKSVMTCPVCGLFTAATGTDVDAHITSCLVQIKKKEKRQMRMNCKGKLKSPKKRLITEIFAVAPQIETVESIYEEDYEEVDEALHCGKGGSLDQAVPTTTKSTPSIHANKKSTVRKKMRRMKKKTKLEKSATSIKIKRRKKNILKKGSSAKKEHEYKMRLPKSVRCVRKLIGSCHSERPLGDVADGMSECNKKSELNPGKKRKVQKPEPVAKQKKVFPHGILKKNHPTSTSEKTLAISNNKDGVRETNFCYAENLASNRHVKFSGKDDILGSGLRNSTSGRHLLDFFSEDTAVPPTKENSGVNVEKEKGYVDQEANKCCCSVSTKTNRRVVVPPVFENEKFSNTSEHVTKLTLLKPHVNHEKSMHLTLKSGPENHFPSANNSTHVDKGKTMVMHSPPYAGFPQSSLASQGGQDSSMNYLRCANVPGSCYSGVNLNDYIVDSTNAMTGMNSRTNGKPPYLQPPAAFSVMNAKRIDVLQSLIAEDDDCVAPSCCQLPQVSSLGKMYEFCPSLDQMKGSAAFRRCCRNERSFCLPLNSHGELIRFSSSENVAYRCGDSSTLSSTSSSGLPVNLELPIGQENLRTRETDLTEIALNRCRVNPFPNYPARLGVTERQVNERANMHYPQFECRWNRHDCAIDMGRSITKNSFDEELNNQVANQHGKNMIHLMDRLDFPPVNTSQPTMRLMGKDVTISSSEYLQRSVGESRRKVSCRDTDLGSYLFVRTSEEDRSFSLSEMMPTEPVSQAANSIVNGREGAQSMLLSYGPESKSTRFLLNPRANAMCRRDRFPSGRNYQHHFAQSPGFYQELDREADFTLPLIPRSQHIELRPQLQVPPTPNSIGQHTYGSSVELVHKNIHLPKSAYDFSLSHRGEQECAPVTSQYLTRMPSINLQQDVQGSSFLNAPLVYHPTEFSYPLNPVTPRLPMKSSLVPDSFVHTPCFTTLTGVDTNVPTTMCRDKPKERMLNFGVIKYHDLFPGCRKRPATHVDDSARPTKIHNLPMQEFSNLTVMALESSRGIGPNQGGVDAKGRVGFLNEIQSFRSKAHAGFDSWSPYGVARSGLT